MGARWRQLAPATEPHVWNQYVQLDESTDVVAMVGWAPATNDIRTYKWDGSDWTQIIAGPNPTPAASKYLTVTDLAWDGVNSKVMMVCTQIGTGVPGTPLLRFFHLDWVTPTWTEITPATRPTTTSLFAQCMFWIPAAGVVGLQMGNSADTLWTWDGTDFTNTGLHPTSDDFPIGAQPWPTNNMTNSVYRWYPPRDVVVEYGGNPSGITDWITTSTLDAAVTAYTGETPTNNPGARGSSRTERRWMAYLSCVQALAVWGDTFPLSDNTWLYLDVGGGTYDWQDQGVMSPSPTATGRNPAMCTDRSGNVLLLNGSLPYGATMETWILRCGRPQVIRWR